MSKKVFTLVFNTLEELSKEECDLYSSKITNYARDIIPNIDIESSLITDNNRSVISLSKENKEENSDENNDIVNKRRDERDRLEQEAYLNMKYDPEYFIIRSLIAMCKNIESEILETSALFDNTTDGYLFAGNNILEYKEKFAKGYTIFANGNDNRNYKVSIKRTVNEHDRTKIFYTLSIDYIAGDPTKKFLKLRGLLLKRYHIDFLCKDWRDNKQEVLIEYIYDSTIKELLLEINNTHIHNFLFNISQYESRTFWSDIYHVGHYQYSSY